MGPSPDSEIIEGVAGVIIWTDNLERLLRFYRDLLGLRPHSVQPHFVAFRFGDVRLSLGVHSQVSGRAQEPYRIMVNLSVRDIHESYRALVAKGVEFIRPPEREHWGGWVATFRDPDGNILQLLQQPDGKRPGPAGSQPSSLMASSPTEEGRPPVSP